MAICAAGFSKGEYFLDMLIDGLALLFRSGAPASPSMQHCPSTSGDRIRVAFDKVERDEGVFLSVAYLSFFSFVSEEGENIVMKAY